MNKLILIIAVVYILITQSMLNGYGKINRDMNTSLDNLMAACINGPVSDLSEKYR